MNDLGRLFGIGTMLLLLLEDLVVSQKDVRSEAPWLTDTNSYDRRYDSHADSIYKSR